MGTPSFRKINLKAYKPGRSILKKNKRVIKLSANESALGISNRAQKAFRTFNAKISKYPDGNFKELKNIISKKYNCDQNRVICGSGSDEIIQLICNLFLKNKDEVIVTKYSFVMYRIYSKICGAKVIYAKEDNFKISINNITLSKIRSLS